MMGQNICYQDGPSKSLVLWETDESVRFQLGWMGRLVEPRVLYIIKLLRGGPKMAEE